MLTTRQREVLDFVKTFLVDHGYPPTVREIGESLRISSPSTVHAHLEALRTAGALVREEGKPRAMRVADDPLDPGHCPVCGSSIDEIAMERRRNGWSS